MSTIGSLAVNITANQSSFNKGIQSSLATLKEFSNKASLIGAGVTTAIGGMVAKFAEAGAQLGELSAATGLGIGQLSFLKFAAEQTGSSLEVFTKAARNLIQKGIDPSRFEEFAAKIAAIRDPVQRGQQAMYYFGTKSGLLLSKMIQQLPELKKRFIALGGGFTEEMANRAEQLKQSWGQLQFALSNVFYEIADALAPAIIAVTDWIASNGAAIKQWIADHQGVVVAIAATAAVLATLAPIMFVISTGIGVVTTAVGGLNVAFAFLAANPVILTIAGIVAGITALVWILERAFGAWTKFKNAIGASDSGNYISRALTPKSSVPGMAGGMMAGSGNQDPAAYIAAQNQVVQGALGKGDLSDNDTVVKLMEEMNGHLAKMSGNPPIQLATAGIR